MSTMMASAAGLQTDNRMAIGTGVYRGQAALAIGYQRKIGSRATVTIGGSTAGGSEYNVGVGAGFGW
ncbi:YadA C-terminal domain-containing protein [Ralstonia holmesii]|nr:YadA C-terminal domain-containing protein [Ralstonia sp. LMG 32967]